MFPNWKARQVELIDKAEFFEYAGYPIAAKWVKQLARNVGIKNPVTNLEKDLDETMSTWESEYVKGDALRRKRFDSISGVLLAAAKTGKLEQEIQSLMPIIQELSSNVQNFAPIVKAFKPFREKRDFKMQYYGMCILYMLDVEGVFDQAIRCLYVLISALRGLPVSVVKANQTKLVDIRAGFRKLRVPDVFFVGWEDGHVRNSIAHGSFRYDDKSGRMIFKDVNPWTLKEWKKDLTILQFEELFFNVDDVWFVLENLFFLLRVTQLVVAKQVPRVGMDLIMPRIRQAIKSGVANDLIT